MFSSGCLELGLVAAIFVAVITFVIDCIIHLHIGITLPLSVLKALLAAAISFGIAALLLTLASIAIHLFGGRTGTGKGR